MKKLCIYMNEETGKIGLQFGSSICIEKWESAFRLNMQMQLLSCEYIKKTNNWKYIGVL